jgi:hypothetical protein
MVLAAVVMFGCLFSVQNADADTDYERIINRAYEDILGRKADPSGMRMYRVRMIDEGWSEGDVRNDLRNSPEYKNKKVDLIIKRAYQDLLGRDPDRAGYEKYRQRLVEVGWDEEDVRRNIRESQEYRNKH